MKRAISLCCLCLLILTGCGGKSDTVDTGTTAVDTTAIETEPAIAVKDFGGETVTIYIRYDTEGYEWNVSDLDAVE